MFLLATILQKRNYDEYSKFVFLLSEMRFHLLPFAGLLLLPCFLLYSLTVQPSRAQFDEEASSYFNDYYFPEFDAGPVENVTNPCNDDEMTCQANKVGTCVKKCDNHFDCHDCEDELDCDHSPFSQIFQCADKKACVFVGRECPSIQDETLGANNDMPVNQLHCVRFCDGVEQCPDGSDEPSAGFGFKCDLDRPYQKRQCVVPENFIERWENITVSPKYEELAICSDKSDLCYRNGIIDLTKCFPCVDGTILNKEQLCDGNFDCIDLSDECLCSNPRHEISHFCKLQQGKNPCQGKYRCNKNGHSSCFSLEELINGISDCPEDLFKRSIHEKDISYNCKSGNTIRAEVCNGVPECPGREDECQNCTNTIPEFCDEMKVIEACGAGSGYKFCDGKPECKDGYDEKYCPNLKDCSASGNEKYYTWERCDYQKDCANGKDEMNCSDTHYYCQHNKSHYIRMSQVRDKIFDCKLGDDECFLDRNDSSSSGQYMIRHTPLVVGVWTMAFLALIGNLVVIIISVRDLNAYRRRSSAAIGWVGSCNKTLVLNLAIADFLMGVYLLILGVKAAQYKGVYCQVAEKWLTSSLCSCLGTMAVLSSQASVLIMVMMTTYRLYSLRHPFKTEKLRVKHLGVVVIIGWIAPILFAIYPLMAHNENYAFSLTSSIGYFKDSYVVDKPRFEKFVKESWRMSNFSQGNELPQRDWDSLMNAFCIIYPKVCGDKKERSIVKVWYGYYSSDSVCLPRLFPKVGDGGWEYTVVMIVFDFIAFIYILIAYLMMCKFTVTGTYVARSGTFRGSSFSSVDELRSKEDRVIWRRISRLLLTDFLCWIPICVTCFLSLAEVQIDPILYQISAIILMPINSALNPVVYSSGIFLEVKRFRPKWLRSVREFYVSLCKRLRGNGTHTPPSEIRLDVASAPSASDDLGLNADQLIMTSAADTPSNTLPDPDRLRLDSTPENKQLKINRRVGVFLNNNGVHTELLDSSDKQPSGMSRFSRFFSSRRQYRNRRFDPGVSYRRPKSQSTTSTCTTNTTVASEEG